MTATAHSTVSGSARAFTLLELLVATTIFAVLAGALYTVLTGALHMRERAYAAIEQELPPAVALEVLRRDLACMTIPTTGTQNTIITVATGSTASATTTASTSDGTTNTLTGPMLGTADRRGGQANDTLEFITATGVIGDKVDDYWGDIQQVTYSLQDADQSSSIPGRELVREVRRNLLSPTQVEPARERLLTGVRSLQFDYLDSKTWYDSWDSTQTDNEPPEAVRVRVEFLPGGDADQPRPPLELVCEVVAQPKATDETTTSTASTL